jgi:hypothetical protein
MFSSFAKSLWIRGAITLVSAVNLLAAPPARAAAKTWPAAFCPEQIPVSDGNQYVPVAGFGAGVALLHGFGDTGDMWAPLAEALAKDHTAIVPASGSWKSRPIRPSPSSPRSSATNLRIYTQTIKHRE